MSEMFEAACEIREPLAGLRDETNGVALAIEGLDKPKSSLHRIADAIDVIGSQLSALIASPDVAGTAHLNIRAGAYGLTAADEARLAEVATRLEKLHTTAVSRLLAVERAIWELYPDTAERIGVQRPMGR